MKSIGEGDDSVITPTKLTTSRAGSKAKNLASDDAPPNAELGLQRFSLEDCSAGGIILTPINISDSIKIKTDKTSDANSIAREFLSNVVTNNSKEHTAKLQTESIWDQPIGLEPNTVTPS